MLFSSLDIFFSILLMPFFYLLYGSFQNVVNFRLQSVLEVQSMWIANRLQSVSKIATFFAIDVWDYDLFAIDIWDCEFLLQLIANIILQSQSIAKLL